MQNITKNNNLKKIEKTIDLIKLQIINSIKKNSTFSMDTILAYYLELSILERQTSLIGFDGEKNIQKILKSINIEVLNEFR